MTKIHLLQSLVQFDQPLNEILNHLNKMDWDSDQSLVILKQTQIVALLQRYISHSLSATDIEDWANAIECREDIGYEEGYEDLLRDIIYELANPFLTRSLSPETANELLNNLSVPVSSSP